jgi:hypothetical protein
VTYDTGFFDAYKRYLDEQVVRERHTFALDALGAFRFRHVLDLGCGTQEYVRRRVEHNRTWKADWMERIFGNSDPFTYVPVDRVPMSGKYTGNDYVIIGLDYRKELQLLRNFPNLVGEPDAFISLFSTEITAPAHENYEYYTRLFQLFPSIRHGLVSGFYYANRKNTNPVEEAGNIVSWQTLEPIEHVVLDVYDERRLTMHVPSEMFGDDVYEVWKLFTRIG